MSFWQSLQRSVDSVVASASNSYTNLTSFPEEVTCTYKDCHGTVTRIPAKTFEWTCINSHVVSPNLTTCPSCNSTKSEAKARGLYKPSVHCSGCQRVLELSETTIANNFWSAVYSTPNHIENAYQSAKHEIKELTAPPETFECRHCNVLLYTPTGPWLCSFENCSSQNGEGTYSCGQCGASRFVCGVVCSICSRATPVPGTKLEASVKSTLHTASNYTQYGYRYAAGECIAKCTTCQFPMPIEKEQARLIFGLGPNDPVPGFDEEKPHQHEHTKEQRDQEHGVLPDGSKMTQDEADIFAQLNTEEVKQPLTSQQPPNGEAGAIPLSISPTPQDILCTKCLHLNTVSKEFLISRKLASQQDPQPQQQQQAQQPEQPATDAAEAQNNTHLLSAIGVNEAPIKHVDEEGNPIRCISCSATSSTIKPVVPCGTCRNNYCRKCAPFSRTLAHKAHLFCYECAKSYDQDVARTAQQQQQQPQQQPQPNQPVADVPAAQAAAVPAPQPVVAPTEPQVDSAPAPQADPYDALQ